MRLPTLRSRFTDTAERQQLTCRGFLAELLLAECDERDRRRDERHRLQRSLLRMDEDFTDPRLCAAIVDRLIFGGNIIQTGTDSYRLARTRAQLAS